MSELAARKCTPYAAGAAALPSDEATRLLGQLDSAWQLVEAGRALRRELSFKDFYRTMSFVNAVAHIANVEDHHPDLEVGYGYCRIRYSTHSVGGLSENDFICAAKIDQLV
jgi:4a-hydroxytetrahydrobiopterin dehydratase